MGADKSLKSMVGAMAGVVGMEAFWGFNKTIRKQLGVVNLLKMTGKAAARGGFRKTFSDLAQFRLGDLTANAFLSAWEVLGDREAIVDGDRRFTFAQMHDRVLSLANAFQSYGAKPGDRVGCMLYNCAEFFECFYAACLIGTPFPPVNWHLDGQELRETIKLRAPKVFIFDSAFADRIMAIKNDLVSVERFIMVGGGTPPPGVESYEAVISGSPADVPEKTSFIVAINPYTGGTTGIPKSSNLYDSFSYLLSDKVEAPRSSLADYLKYMIMQYSYFHYYGCASIKDPVYGNIRSLIVTPLYHAGTAAGYAPCLLLGATAVLMRKFDPEKYLRMIEKERISWAFAVPTILQRILALPEEVKGRYDLSSMRALFSAAAPCPPDVKTAINDLFMKQGARQPVFHEYYGSSESAVITLLLPEDYLEKPERVNSVGKARCGDILIYDDINDVVCGPGQEGLVLGRTVGTMSLRYPGSEEKLKDNHKIVNGVEWYNDKLIGYVDADGFLYLTGRIKEMIISGGVNIFPLEIENVLVNHPKIADVAVIRAPDPDLGEVPLACIQLQEGETATADEIREFCRQRGLKGFKIPKEFVVYDELPRHIDGKLIKRKLEEPFWKDVKQRG
ncbi:MAG: AMP-binding protein [Thermodesulfobacteriota bacterium]